MKFNIYKKKVIQLFVVCLLPHYSTDVRDFSITLKFGQDETFS